MLCLSNIFGSVKHMYFSMSIILTLKKRIHHQNFSEHYTSMITNLILCPLRAVLRSGSLGLVSFSFEHAEFCSTATACKNRQMYRVYHVNLFSTTSRNKIIFLKDMKRSCPSQLQFRHLIEDTLSHLQIPTQQQY